ncbi:MAG: gliding motility-associated protein GldE [Bacteroidales bacterium]|nr:gliding motility-associated protein GldE [Bacteroidales bacterium]
MNETEPGLYIIGHIFSLNNIMLPFTMDALLSILSIFVLIIFSGLISGSEIAFFSLDPLQIEDIKSQKDSENSRIIKLLESPKKLLAGILISNNFINVSIILISTYLTQILFDFSNFMLLGFIFQVIGITSILLLFGEIIPKIYAKNNGLIFVRLMAAPLVFTQKIFKPLIHLLVFSTNIIDNRISKKKNSLSMTDLSEVVDLAASQTDGEQKDEETMILKGIATYGETDVKEIMKARVDVSAIELNASFDEVLESVREWGYSRIPIYEDTLDQIKGILYIKDLLSFIEDKNHHWNKKIRKSFFVPENKKINDLLQEFRQKRIHMAIVVDEYGGTSGIVTLEDILEEIVGDINDEFDIQNEDFVYNKIDKHTWVFEAKTTLLDLCKVIGIDNDTFDDVKGESDSIAGVILEIKGDFPEVGKEIEYEGIVFEVLSMDARRISRVRVKTPLKTNEHAE